MQRSSPSPLIVWLGCLLVQLGCQPRGAAPTLSELHGCDDVWHEPGAGHGDGGTYVCALAESSGQTVRIWVQAAAPTGVALARSGAGKLSEHGLEPQLSEQGRLELDVDRALMPAQVAVTDGSLRGRMTGRPAVRLRFVRQALLPIEAAAEAARQEKKIGDGITALRAAQATPPYSTDPVAKARLLHKLADLEVDDSRHEEARQHFEQALELAIPAGLTLIAANSARRLAFQHYKLRHDIPMALAILDQYDAAIRMIDIEAVLVIYNRGIYAQERGHLSEAVHLLTTAKEAIKDLGEDSSRRRIAVMYVEVLAQQGLFRKAEKELQELLAELQRPGGTFDVCDRLRILNTLGWTRILAQEARSGEALATTEPDPIPLFQQALSYQVPGGCAGEGRNIAVNWARAELLSAERLAELATAPGMTPGMAAALGAQVRGHLQAATEHLAEGTRDEDRPTVSRQLDASEISGRIAYLQSDWAEAATRFAQLAELAGDAEEQDYQARAFIGQALVNTALARTAADAAAAERYTQAASAAFERAEAQIDEWLGFVPLTTTRRAFLPRFAAGTAAFIDFLIAHHHLPRALAVARRAQVRGLVTSLSFDRLDLLPAAQQLRLMQERNEFVRQSALPGNQSAAGSLFATLLTHLREAGLGQLPLRPLQPGEAMHLCHPLPHGDLACFVADAQELQVERVSAPALEHATPEQQAALLLRPFARLIDRARVLRVVPSQKLREVNFPALPWAGESGYLASRQRLVVSALDLDLGTRTAALPAVRGKALMLVNQNLQAAQKSAPGLFAGLQQLGWQVKVYSNQQFEHGTNPRRQLLCWWDKEQCQPPLALPVDTLPGTASAMKQALTEVELAQLDTHASYNEEDSWQSELVMPDQSRLQITDLMNLPRAPQWTVLLVCEGGTAGKGADADDISLAQALLLRGGAAVVAATRPLEDELSGRWSQALYGNAHLSAARPSLPEAFHAAQTALQQSHAAPSDWSALRLFVP